jgi:hypothetical protein
MSWHITRQPAPVRDGGAAPLDDFPYTPAGDRPAAWAADVRLPPRRRLAGWLYALLPLPGIAAVSAWLAGSPDWIAPAVFPPFVLVVPVALLLRLGALHYFSGRGWLAYGWCWLAWGCWLGAGLLFWATTVRVEFRTDPREGDGPLPLRVLYDGRPVVTLDRPQKCTFGARFFRRDRVAVQAFGPDGWVNCPLGGAGGDVVIENMPLAVVYVDNRGHAAAELACGQVRLTVTAGARAVWKIAAPAAGRPLTIDGHEMGVLDAGAFLVDVAGDHAYRLHDHIYRDSKITLPGLLANPQPDAVLRWQRFYPLPRQVDYFLVPAPRSVEGFIEATRSELLDER